jgi:hypothetical protein
LIGNRNPQRDRESSGGGRHEIRDQAPRVPPWRGGRILEDVRRTLFCPSDRCHQHLAVTTVGHVRFDTAPLLGCQHIVGERRQRFGVRTRIQSTALPGQTAKQLLD